MCQEAEKQQIKNRIAYLRDQITGNILDEKENARREEIKILEAKLEGRERTVCQTNGEGCVNCGS